MSETYPYHQTSWIGLRANQEDYGRVLAFPDSGDLLAVVADGMGGHSGGEIASLNAVESFISNFSRSIHLETVGRLKKALEFASDSIGEIARNQKELDGLGCTLVAAFVKTNRLYWISVGDSHLYHYRAGVIRKINEDHSMAPIIAQYLEKGQITTAEAEQHPHRNALRSAVMGPPPPMVDASKHPIDLLPGDYVVLATDGLNTLTSDSLLRIILKSCDHGPKAISEGLIESIKAADKPRQDNVHITCIQVTGMGLPAGIRKARRYKRYLLPLFSFIGAGLGTAGYFYYSNHDTQKYTEIDGMVEEKKTALRDSIPLTSPPTGKSMDAREATDITPTPLPVTTLEPSPPMELKPSKGTGRVGVQTEHKTKETFIHVKPSSQSLEPKKKKGPPEVVSNSPTSETIPGTAGTSPRDGPYVDSNAGVVENTAPQVSPGSERPSEVNKAVPKQGDKQE